MSTNSSEIDQIKEDRVIWVDELDELKEEHSQVSEEHRELDELRTSHFEERATQRLKWMRWFQASHHYDSNY